jgi:hypothetical protein
MVFLAHPVPMAFVFWSGDMTKFLLIHEKTGWILDWQDEARFSYAPPSAGQGRVPITDAIWEMRKATPQAYVDGGIVDFDPSSIPPPEPEPEPETIVPSSVTMRQARLALLAAGLLDTIETAIAALPGMEGEAARIEWEYATTIERANPLFSALTAQLGIPNEQLDQLFITAAGL